MSIVVDVVREVLVINRPIVLMHNRKVSMTPVELPLRAKSNSRWEIKLHHSNGTTATRVQRNKEFQLVTTVLRININWRAMVICKIPITMVMIAGIVGMLLEGGVGNKGE